MKWKWVLPMLYVLSSALLLILFTEPELRWENLLWFSITLPASLVVNLSETPAAMLAAFVAATLQYWALGSYLDRRRRSGQRMKWALRLPALYLFFCFVAFLFSGAGHGPGGGIWLWGSMPASLIVWFIETPLAMLASFLAAILQYWALGLFLDRLRKNGKDRKRVVG